jgi:hypothetical protein
MSLEFPCAVERKKYLGSRPEFCGLRKPVSHEYGIFHREASSHKGKSGPLQIMPQIFTIQSFSYYGSAVRTIPNPECNLTPVTIEW